MADLKQALDFVFGNEGGFVDNPADHGGATNLGVTQATLDAARKARPKAGYPKSVKDLTRDQAIDIYAKDYAPKGWDDITDQAVATVLLDMAINSGQSRAVTLMQRALCAIGGQVGVDGSFGPATLAAINAAEPHALLGAFRQQRVAFYHHLVDANPTQAVFLKGWLRRADAIPMEA